VKQTPKRYTITAALPYANGPVHLGHLAGVYIPADIYARYLRLQGRDVVFICGSDEHGVPITIKAKKEGITPQAVVDRYHEIIGKSFSDFGISFDNYSRTSAPIHPKENLLKKLQSNSLTQKPSNFWPTDLLLVLVQNAAIPKAMEISVNNAVPVITRQTLSAQKVPCPGVRLYANKPSTGFYL